MGKNKKAFVSDAGGNKIVHPADFQRKKAKTKLIEKRKKDRKENYEASMLTKAPELIENEIREYKEMEAAGKLTKWKKDRMSREIAFYDRLKDQVGENQQKRDERNKNNSLHVDFDELKIHRKASIYYDPVKNPYGAPPTGQMLMSDVAYVLRAMGLTIYGSEEKLIKEQVEKVDGMGKPVTFQTVQNWVEEHRDTYVKSYGDAYSAVGTLCHEGIIGDKTAVIQVAQLRHLVSEVGDKIKAETVDKILKGGDMPGTNSIKGETCTLDEFLVFLQK
ncbi:unnamed protein product [Polarella glacialis]|uniref:Wbp11/ELF5/Saf1 N-terminal domain-containing protein n=1 Tax=Polarella glacialis TaxID=89957 RepID=A0A813I2A6_POLGL|nr:unnamed protein product [Polarella glacialis]